MEVGGHVLVGSVGLGQRETAVHGQRQCSCLDIVPQIVAHPRDDLPDLIERASSESDPDVVEPLRRVEIEIEFSLRTAQTANIDHATTYRGYLHGQTD